MILVNYILSSALLLLFLLVVLGCDSHLSKEDHGNFRGSGTKIYAYEDGGPKRIDQYVDSRLIRSVWYDLDGKTAVETNWTKNGEGLEYYINDAGKITSKAEVSNYELHGRRWYYDDDGNIKNIAIYQNGEIKETKKGDIHNY